MICERMLKGESNGKCICISSAMFKYMNEIRGIPKSKMVVVHNGVDNPEVTIPLPWKNNIKNCFHCMQCGHLSIAKGQVESIRAIGELKRRGINDIYLHLAGTPAIQHGVSYKDTLDNMIKDLDLEKQVIFEGEVEDMKLLRKNMQLELICSVCEPFGRVTVEAMQMGIPVVGANTGGTLDIIIDGYNGLLYEQGNYVDLADKIERLYHDYDYAETLSDNCLEFTKTHFTMDQNVAEINQAIREVVTKN